MLTLPGNLSPEQFLDQYWQKRPLLMPAALPRIRPSVTRNELGWLATLDDVESRIAALEKTHAQLLDLLGKARNVQEALEVRRSLDEIAMELEVLKGRMRKLQNMISFSTLTLSMVERGPHMPTPTSNDPFHWVDGLGVESTEWK